MASSTEPNDETHEPSVQVRALSCFHEWMNLQELDLSELLQALNIEANSDHNEEDIMETLVEKNIKHFEKYAEKRLWLAHQDVSTFFVPTRSSKLENCFLWLAGCRPSIFILIMYELCGLGFELHLEEFLYGVETGNLGYVSANQLRMSNNLHGRIIGEERNLSERYASLQERIADQPIVKIAKQTSEIYSEPNMEADDAIEEFEKSLMTIMEEADKLRLNTLRELTSILTPFQGVNFLAASNKFHVCIHKWGLMRDQSHGRREC